MRLLLITAGSRGDVQPFLALARAALAAGHEVRVAAPDEHGAATDGIDVTSLGVSYSALIRAQGVSVVAAMRAFRTAVEPVMRGVIVGAVREALAFEPDVVVAHPKVLSAPLIAEAMGVPHVLVELVPAVTPTRSFPAAGTLPMSAGLLNRATYRAGTAAAWMFTDALREAEGLLPARPRRRLPSPAATLVPVSPALLPRPSDWPASVHLTGAWTDSGRPDRLHPEVAEFLAGRREFASGARSAPPGRQRARRPRVRP